MRGTVVIFAKAPRAGAVKTRLGTHIGMGRAAALFRIMTERTSAEVSRGPWRTIVAVDPPSALAGWRTLFPPRIPRIAQGRGDLGQRMARVMNMVTEGPVIIVGADAPGMRARHLRNAFAALARADAVFGPATDGGYWLIGLARRRSAPGLFQNVRWSSKHALDDTRASLPAIFETTLVDTLPDIDEPGDLRYFGLRATAR
jgi:rSAM/selenodomain-associated transferase 1